jgi:hypothetical protein
LLRTRLRLRNKIGTPTASNMLHCRCECMGLNTQLSAEPRCTKPEGSGRPRKVYSLRNKRSRLRGRLYLSRWIHSVGFPRSSWREGLRSVVKHCRHRQVASRQCDFPYSWPKAYHIIVYSRSTSCSSEFCTSSFRGNSKLLMDSG